MEVWLSMFGCRVGWPGLYHVLGLSYLPRTKTKVQARWVLSLLAPQMRRWEADAWGIKRLGFSTPQI